MHVTARTYRVSFWHALYSLLNENVVGLPLQNLCLYAHTFHVEVVKLSIEDVVWESPYLAKGYWPQNIIFDFIISNHGKISKQTGNFIKGDLENGKLNARKITLIWKFCSRVGRSPAKCVVSTIKIIHRIHDPQVFIMKYCLPLTHSNLKSSIFFVIYFEQTSTKWSP